MKTLLRLMAFIVLAATPAFSYAQLRSYSCDFEDTAECTLWHIENFHDTVSFTGWRIGSTPGNTSCSLYIDIDPSISDYPYELYSMFYCSMAERTITLAGGIYRLSFDFRSLPATGLRDTLVYWIPADLDIELDYTTLEQIKNGTLLGQYLLANGTFTPDPVTGHTKYNTTITSLGSPCKLLFLFVHHFEEERPGVIIGGGDRTVQPQSVFIDNISITPENASCLPPDGITLFHTADSIFATWSTPHDTCEIRYRFGHQAEEYTYLPMQPRFATPITVEDTAFTFLFSIRSYCPVTDEWSNWVSSSITVRRPSVPETINYTDLDGADTFCYIADSINTDELQFRPCAPVDSGTESPASRHTVYDGLIHDAQIGILINTPYNQPAVRLGNPGTSCAEQIEYRFKVTEENANLTIRFMALFQNEDHSAGEKALFSVTLLDRNKQELTDQCVSFDVDNRFEHCSSDINITSYSLYPDNPDYDILWNSWETVSVNLSPFIGQTLYLRLTTSDCRNGAHFGYAYYTISTSPLKITVNSTAGNNKWTAPDGYLYRWHNADNPDSTLSTGQTFSSPAADKTCYQCDLKFPFLPDCYTTLRACPLNITFTDNAYTLCLNDTALDIMYSCTGTPVSYSVHFTDTIASPMNIADRPSEGDYITISPDSAVPTGIYHAAVTFRDADGMTTTTDLTLSLMDNCTVATFEDTPLPAESHWHGSIPEDPIEGSETSWNSGYYNFSVTNHSTSWWNGFALSNETSAEYNGHDSTIFRSAAGGGYMSDTYSVVCPDSSHYIRYTSGIRRFSPSGVYVTNTARVKDAILNGDGYTSVPNPFIYGDSLLLTAYGVRDNKITGWADFYLADYRSPDASEHYCIDTWEWFDLRPLGTVEKIMFTLTSSKTADGYSTTPAYFCMDNFNDRRTVDSLPPTDIIGDSTYIIDLDTLFDPVDFSSPRKTRAPNRQNSSIHGIHYAFADTFDTSLIDAVISGHILSITPKMAGETTITISATSKGRTLYASLPVKTGSVTSADLGTYASGHTRIYPNPAHDFICIDTDMQGEITIELFDISGRRILRQISADTPHTLSLPDIAPGIYILQLNNGSSSSAHRISIL